PAPGPAPAPPPAAQARPGSGTAQAPVLSGSRGADQAVTSPARVRPTPPTPPSTRIASAAPTSGSPAATLGASSAGTPPRTPPAHTRSQAQVTLRYSADSWTEVYDATGARLFYDVGAANSVQTVVGTPPLRVVLGNASGVAVEFNGHDMPVAKFAHPDGSVQ